MPNNPVMLSAEEYEALIAASVERDALRGELRLVTAQRDLAEEKLRAYKHELFGASSEARHADQLGLFNEAEALATATDAPAREDVPGTSVAAHTRGKRGRKPLDPNLPREAVRHELPESERFCAHDGHALVEIGVETSEQLDVIPEQVRVVQHQRVKYACPCCDLGIKVTPAPARIIPRGLLTESALAWIITGKYQYGMPLYRQATLLRRFGGDISSNTLAASVVRVGLATQPVINLMRDALLESDLIYGDETTFQVLKEPGRRPQAKSYLWAQVNGSGPTSTDVLVLAGARRPACAEALCRRAAWHRADDGWVRALQRHRPRSPARASRVLGTRAPRLHQGRGIGAEGGTLVGSAGYALRRADRQAVRGRGAQREVEA
ncbi:transposase IS66 family protein [Burkholderia pseudomallei MSHR7500]|nr:transposase IS66 family protein [Burkholderia pseudomallei MSHR7500]